MCFVSRDNYIPNLLSVFEKHQEQNKKKKKVNFGAWNSASRHLPHDLLLTVQDTNNGHASMWKLKIHSNEDEIVSIAKAE